MLDTQSPWDCISLPCCLTKDVTGWHYCLTPSSASSCCLPFLPPVLTPNKHLAPQTLSLPLLLKKSNLWQLTPGVVWKSRWWDGLWNRLAWRSPSLLVGWCVSALGTSCCLIVHTFTVGTWRGVQVKVKARTGVQAFEPFEGNSCYRDNGFGWLLIRIINALQKDDKQLRVIGNGEPGVKTRGLLGCI